MRLIRYFINSNNFLKRLSCSLLIKCMIISLINSKSIHLKTYTI